MCVCVCACVLACVRVCVCVCVCGEGVPVSVVWASARVCVYGHSSWVPWPLVVFFLVQPRRLTTKCRLSMATLVKPWSATKPTPLSSWLSTLWVQKSESRLTASSLKQDPTRERFKRTLFIKTKRNTRIFGIMGMPWKHYWKHYEHENHIAQPKTDERLSSPTHFSSFFTV